MRCQGRPEDSVCPDNPTTAMTVLYTILANICWPLSVWRMWIVKRIGGHRTNHPSFYAPSTSLTLTLSFVHASSSFHCFPFPLSLLLCPLSPPPSSNSRVLAYDMQKHNYNHSGRLLLWFINAAQLIAYHRWSCHLSVGWNTIFNFAAAHGVPCLDWGRQRADNNSTVLSDM